MLYLSPQLSNSFKIHASDKLKHKTICLVNGFVEVSQIIRTSIDKSTELTLNKFTNKAYK